MKTIETDYLVIGAGAAGMSFTDALIDADPDCDVVMVDRRHSPGGHWNDAYPFVRLHQPAACYGVNSRRLGNDEVDESGLNAGLYEQADGVQICDYFRHVMDEHHVASGQVRFFPMSNYLGLEASDVAFVATLTGGMTQVKVRRAVVDARYLEPTIPLRHTAIVRCRSRCPMHSREPAARRYASQRPATRSSVGARRVPMRAHGFSEVESTRTTSGGYGPETPGCGTGPKFSRSNSSPTRSTVSLAPWRRRPKPRASRTSSLGSRPVAICSDSIPVSRRRCTTRQRSRSPKWSACGPSRMSCDSGTSRRSASTRLSSNKERSRLTAGTCSSTASAGLRKSPARPIFEPGRITLQCISTAHPTFNAAVIGYIEASRGRRRDRQVPPLAHDSLSGRSE